MSQETEVSPLIQTKLHQPRLIGDLIKRARLLERLEAHRERPLTLISAPAGYGKTTLLAQWLDQAPYQATWLSLDENDNDLTVFLSYIVAAIQTLFPNGCTSTQGLLAAPQMPPLDYLTTTLINEITALPEGFLLVLDDYHLIKDPDIHQLILALVQYAPPPLRLVMTTRSNPPFSISRLRATQKITEIRINDLRFTPEEVQTYLKLSLGAEVSPETVTVLATRTEGWAAGLHLACLALQDQSDSAGFLQTFRGTQRYIMEYLVDEVLSHQPQQVREFLLGTSILGRFCAPLGDAVVKTMRNGNGSAQLEPSGQDILEQLEKVDLFVVSLDEQGQWYRYHQLFKDLLFHKLAAEISETQLAKLHIVASDWLNENGFIEEAFEHVLAANDLDRAVQLLETHRHDMMNREQWPRLGRWLDRLPPHLIEQRVPLLLAKAWNLATIQKFKEIIPILEQVESMLAQDTPELSQEQHAVWGGEVAALRGVIVYWLGQGESCLKLASHALKVTPPEQAWVIGFAKNCQIVAYQLLGRLDMAYRAMHQAEAEFGRYNEVFAAQIRLSHMIIEILSGNLPGAKEASTQLVNLAQPCQLHNDTALGFQLLGYIHYQWNELEAAERYFSKVLELRFQSNPPPQAYSFFGLALTCRALGRHDEAAQLADEAIEWARVAGSPALLLMAYSFASRLALLEGQLPDIDHWATSLGDTFLVMILFEIPHLTFATILIARGTPEALQEAAELLTRVRQFVEETHNTWRSIEVLSLQALLHNAQGERESALDLLTQALDLAQPGGFIRLFVDLGPPMADLLTALKPQTSGMQQYVAKILAAFPTDLRLQEEKIANTQGAQRRQSKIQNLVEPLTHREQDVLNLLAERLSDKEIAQRLVISRNTVKTHTKAVFGKLDVKNRRQAVTRARELGLLSSE